MLNAFSKSQFADVRHVLLAGCGGGYDIFGAIPLAVALKKMGKKVSWASLSFTYLNGLEFAEQVPSVPNLYRITAACAVEQKYCPEAWLACWLEQSGFDPSCVWSFDKTGVVPLLHAYEYVVNHASIDAIILMDGGIDALLRGDETSLGTPAEDLTSLAAVQALGLKHSWLAHIGMGAEMRDGISHAQALERIAELTRLGGFLGACALQKNTEEAQAYMDCVQYVFSKQTSVRQSHVHRVILDALEGDFGRKTEHIWINPLMTLLWMFSLSTVTSSHLFLSKLKDTRSIWDVTVLVRALRQEMKIRPFDAIPF